MEGIGFSPLSLTESKEASQVISSTNMVHYSEVRRERLIRNESCTRVLKDKSKNHA